MKKFALSTLFLSSILLAAPTMLSTADVRCGQVNFTHPAYTWETSVMTGKLVQMPENEWPSTTQGRYRAAFRFEATVSEERLLREKKDFSVKFTCFVDKNPKTSLMKCFGPAFSEQGALRTVSGFHNIAAALPVPLSSLNGFGSLSGGTLTVDRSEADRGSYSLTRHLNCGFNQ